MKKFILFLGAVALVSCLLFYKFGTQKVQSNQLVIGVMSGYDPYALINENGQLEGFDIDVAFVLGRRLNKDVVFQDMGLAPLLIALTQNKIDLVISGLCITNERLSKMNMVQYQGGPITKNPLVFWKKVPADVKSILDLKKYPEAIVCVEPGSAQEKYLLQFDFLNLKFVSQMSEIVLDLQYGKSLAAFVDPDVFPLMKEKTPELVALDIELPEDFQSKGNGIAINKNNTELTAKIQTIISDMKTDGTIQSFEQKWFGRSA